MEEYSGGVQRAVTVARGLTTLDDDVISTRDTHNHSVDAAELHVEAIHCIPHRCTPLLRAITIMLLLGLPKKFVVWFCTPSLSLLRLAMRLSSPKANARFVRSALVTCFAG